MIVRDTYSKALLETDVVELQKYRNDKRKDKEMNQLKKEIESLKMCINNLKETVKKLEANRE